MGPRAVPDMVSHLIAIESHAQTHALSSRGERGGAFDRLPSPRPAPSAPRVIPDMVSHLIAIDAQAPAHAQSPRGERGGALPRLPSPRPFSPSGAPSPLPLPRGGAPCPSPASAHPLRRAGSQKSATYVLGIPYSDVEEKYEMGEELGQGLTAVTRACRALAGGELLACKTLPKSRMASHTETAAVRTEVRALRKASAHKGVAALRDVVEDEKSVHIIMELCEGGDLFDSIRQSGPYGEREAAAVVRTVLSVVVYCHAAGIAHRDLKPENILLESADSATRVKVVDFGQAAFFTPGVKLTQTVGTLYYIAPEVLNKSYGPEADMWSLGVILYVLLSGTPPFAAKTEEGTLKKVRAGVFDLATGPWRHVSDEAKDLVRRMLCFDPAMRITAEEAQEHPWLQQQLEEDGPELTHSPDLPPAQEAAGGGIRKLRTHLTIDVTCDEPPTSSANADSYLETSYAKAQSLLSAESTSNDERDVIAHRAFEGSCEPIFPPVTRRSKTMARLPVVVPLLSAKTIPIASTFRSALPSSSAECPRSTKGRRRGRRSKTVGELLMAVAERMKVWEEVGEGLPLLTTAGARMLPLEVKGVQVLEVYNGHEHRLEILFRKS